MGFWDLNKELIFKHVIGWICHYFQHQRRILYFYILKDYFNTIICIVFKLFIIKILPRKLKDINVKLAKETL